MADILDEVLQDQKDETKIQFFKKSLPLVIGFTIVLAIGMQVYDFFDTKRINSNIKNGDIFIKTLLHSSDDSELNALIEKDDTKVAELALIRKVELQLKSQNYNAAKSLLQSFIENKNHSDLLLSYARIAWVSIILDQKEVSSTETDLANKYLAYFSDEKKPFFYVSNLLKALLHNKNGDIISAKEAAEIVLKSTYAPEVYKQQASVILAQ